MKSESLHRTLKSLRLRERRGKINYNEEEQNCIVIPPPIEVIEKNIERKRGINKKKNVAKTKKKEVNIKISSLL